MQRRKAREIGIRTGGAAFLGGRGTIRLRDCRTLRPTRPAVRTPAVPDAADIQPGCIAAFDLGRGVWRKPAHQTKQKRTEHLPLSEQGAALVASILEGADPASPCLFPGYVPGRPPRDI